MKNHDFYKLPAIENWLRSDISMYFILALIMLFSYGYEIFNLNLTIDDELNISNSYTGLFTPRLWSNQGRWGMSILNYLVLPNPIVPVVSTALGVSGIFIGILVILRSIFYLDRMGLLFITAIGATTPVFPFILVYNANAYGIGFGFIAIAIGSLLIHNKNINSLILGCLLASFAIGIYQSFVFVLAIIVIAQIWYFSANSENTFALIRHAVYPLLFFCGSIIAYLIINFAFMWIFLIKHQEYISNQIDIAGLINNPLNKLLIAYYRIMDVINLNPQFFGIQSIWLSIILLLSLVINLVNLLIHRSRFAVGIMTMSIFILFVIIFSIALHSNSKYIPLRTIIHAPLGMVFIVACGYTLSGKYMKPIFILICGLAIIGNSSINNHLFASSVAAEFRDKMLAEDIISEVRKLKPENSQDAVYKLIVIGHHSWPTNAIMSKTEIIGASFFEWDYGNEERIAIYLRLNGLNAVKSKADKNKFYNYIKNMPIWPKTGWVFIINDLLILKLGDYSEQEKQLFCSQGEYELCPWITPSVDMPQNYTEAKPINCDGNVDTINEIQVYNKTVKSNFLIKNNFTLRGWLVVSIKDGIVPDDVFIKLKNKIGSSLYAKMHRYQRKDVNEFYKQHNMPNIGYKRTINVATLNGEYTLNIVRGYKGKLEQCTQFNIPINISR